MLNTIKNSRKIILIDGNAIMYRAYYGVNKNFFPTLNNQPVGMVYGFSSILLNLIEFFQPEFMAITFDSKEKTFRHELDANYKAQRKPAPDDFYPQVPFIYEMAEHFEIPIYKQAGFESDDLIGSLATDLAQKDLNVFIVSGDMDFTQLVSDKIKLLKIAGKIEHSPLYGPAEVEARYGVKVPQMIDFKALMGDSSDNYSGIPGLGPKTAQKILNQYGSIDNLWQKIDDFEPRKIREKIKDNYEYLLHCKKLAAIKTDIPLEFSLKNEFVLNEQKVATFFEKMKFRALENRLLKMNKKSEQYLNLEQKKYPEKSSIDNQLKLF